MKRLAVFVLFFALIIRLPAMAQQTPVERYGRLAVNGKYLVSQKTGQPVQLRGLSLYWSNGTTARNFYNADAVKALRDDWKANLVRAAMGVQATGESWTWGAGQSGYLQDPANKPRVETVVAAAIEHGIYVIIDWHTHNAENNQAEAIAFFEEMANKYKEYPNVIYEIYNEPLNVVWATAVKPYAQAVVNAIRAIDPQNPIIIGTPMWSQRVDQAAKDPVVGDNLLYALHFYAASHKQSVRNYADTAMSKDRAVFVSEFGMCASSGNGDLDTAETTTWLNFLYKNKISWAMWSLSSQGESSAALKSGSPVNGNWTEDNLKESGKYIKARLIADYEADQSVTSVQSAAREIPQSRPSGNFAAVTPTPAPQSGFSAGPVPADRSGGGVKFYWQGKSIKTGSLSVYSTTGNSVKTIVINDASATAPSKRAVGSWDLTDAKGRPAPAGAYLVRGKLTASDGTTANVSAIVGVR